MIITKLSNAELVVCTFTNMFMGVVDLHVEVSGREHGFNVLAHFVSEEKMMELLHGFVSDMAVDLMTLLAVPNVTEENIREEIKRIDEIIYNCIEDENDYRFSFNPYHVELLSAQK